MSKLFNEIQDDQIRIIGKEEIVQSNFACKPRKRNRLKIFIFSILGIAIIGIIFLIFILTRDQNEATTELEHLEPALFEPIRLPEPIKPHWIGQEVDSLAKGFTEIRDTSVNDIPLRIFIPHNAELSLHIGKINKSDTCIIYVAQAADVRADNGEIVGSFVLQGESKSSGISKKGYCASINGKVSIGVADNTSLYDEAIENRGFFFRQYPLVKDGKVIDNEPKGKSIRRAICDRQGEIFMVESGTTESFHDFAQALADFGVNQAVYLVGSSAYGWAVDQTGTIHEFGEDNYYIGRRSMPKNTSYIVWRRK